MQCHGLRIPVVGVLQHRLADLIVCVDEVKRIVISSHGRYLVLCMSEDEYVVVSDFLGYLNVGSVESSDCDGSVNHELHVSCS